MVFALSEMELMSSAFKSQGEIPSKYTGEGVDTSPPMNWINVPDGTRSFAFVCHDPDAPVVSESSYGFVHWVLYNIPGSVTLLSEGTKEYTNGVNGRNKEGYMGPMPPSGHGIHHYFFWLFALNNELKLTSGLSYTQLLELIEPHVIGMNRLVGTYQR
jgi:Raf kinase inhibitor-like YbhB/YbcL family protein